MIHKVFLLLLVLVVGCAVSIQPGQNVQEPQNQPTQVSGGLSSFVVGDFSWRITKTEKKERIRKELLQGQFLGKQANGIFLVVDVEIQNIGSSPKYASSQFLRLFDQKGRLFAPDDSISFYLGPDSVLSFELLNPGVTKKVKLVYDVPEDFTLSHYFVAANEVQASFNTVSAFT